MSGAFSAIKDHCILLFSNTCYCLLIIERNTSHRLENKQKNVWPYQIQSHPIGTPPLIMQSVPYFLPCAKLFDLLLRGQGGLIKF